jgi:hypothetical protein
VSLKPTYPRRRSSRESIATLALIAPLDDATHLLVYASICFEGDLPRHRDHNDVVGNLAPEGERVVGELVEYAVPIIDVIAAYPYSQDEIIAAYRQRCAMRIPPPAPRPAAFRHRSLKRFA